jgi:hypothetical protein
LGKKAPLNRSPTNPTVMCSARSRAVLPLLGAVLPLRRYYQTLARGTQNTSGSAAGAVLPSPPAVLPLRDPGTGEAAVVRETSAVVRRKAVLPC